MRRPKVRVAFGLASNFIHFISKAGCLGSCASMYKLSTGDLSITFKILKDFNPFFLTFKMVYKG